MAYKLNAYNALELKKLVKYSQAKVSQIIELESSYIFVFDCDGRIGCYKAVIKKEDTIKKLLDDNKLIDSLLPIINNVEVIKVEEHDINCIVLLPFFSSLRMPEKLNLGESDYMSPMLEYYQDLKPEDSILKFEIVDYKLKEYDSNDMLTLKISDSITSIEVVFLIGSYHLIMFPEFEELQTYDPGQTKDFIEFIKVMYKRIDFFKSKTLKEFSKKHKINCWDDKEFWQTDLYDEINETILNWIKDRKSELIKTKKKFTFSGLNFLTDRIPMSRFAYLSKDELKKMKKELEENEQYEEISKIDK